MADKPRNTNSEASSRSPSNSNAAGEKIREKLRKKLFDSLQNYKTEEERIQFLVQRILDLEASNTDLRKECEQIKRQNGQISVFEKKVNSLEKQLSKTEMAKSKLEELCRELNKSNKDEKEQNQLRLKALQTVHNDTVNNLKKSLSEIQQSVGAKNEHDKKVAEVEKLSFNLNQLATDYDKRLKDLKKLYDEREDDMKTITREKEDEMTKLRAQIDGMNKRVSGVFDENVHLKQQILTSEQKAQKSIESELGLRKMLDDYSSKYAKLLNSLTQSNKSFDRVKEDMGKVYLIFCFSYMFHYVLSTIVHM